jgi:hypothetical protein
MFSTKSQSKLKKILKNREKLCENFHIFIFSLNQPCPNFTFGGFLPPDLRYLTLIFCDEIWYTDEGGQSRLSDFFWGQESSWWLQNGAPKEKIYLWIVSK